MTKAKPKAKKKVFTKGRVSPKSQPNKTLKTKPITVPVEIKMTGKIEMPKMIADRSFLDIEEEKFNNLEVEVDDLLEDLEELNKRRDSILDQLAENNRMKVQVQDQLQVIEVYRRLRKWSPLPIHTASE